MDKANLNSFSFQQSKIDVISFRATSNDNRYPIPIELCSLMPYCAIGLLKMTYKEDSISYRTGFLIGKNVILTAGHNLYDSRRNPNKIDEFLGNPLKIEFYRGLTNNQSVFKPISGEYKIYYPKDYPKKRNEDYGIIIFKENIVENDDEYFKVKIFNEMEDNEREYYCCGYPLNRTTEDNTVYHLYESKGLITEIDTMTGSLTTNIKSSYGQSGSAMYYKGEDGKFYVVGIHVASSTMNDDIYFSTMITKKRNNQINKWIDEFNKSS